MYKRQQYGKIKTISVKRNKGHSKKHYDSVVYSAYITFKNEIEASLCILSINGKQLGGQKLGASYGMTKYCSYFLDSQNCRNDKCLFLHETAAEEDSFSLYDKQSRGYPTRSSQDEIFNLIGQIDIEMFKTYISNIKKISNKIKKEQEEEFQSSEEEEIERLPSPLELLSNLKKVQPQLFLNQNKPERENQSLKLNLDKVNEMQIHKSWHFSSLKQNQTEDVNKKRQKHLNDTCNNLSLIHI